jgi:mxaJ protein
MLALPLLLSVPQRRELRVCADPNNLPFSNRAGAGYENKIAELVARDLGVTLRYTWWPQRRGFLRNTLNAHHRCDVVIGYPATDPMVLPTRPYYRSTYVFFYERSRDLQIQLP